MPEIVIIYEDAVHEAILRQIIGDRDDMHWIDLRGKTNIDARLNNYREASRYQKIIILRDLDMDANCAPEFLQEHDLIDIPVNFVFRLSVREAEAWLLADKINFCNYFRIGYQHLARQVIETIDHPKTMSLKLIHGGGLGRLRKGGIVTKGRNEYHRMFAYNAEMVKFINTSWDLSNAQENSDSLKRAVGAIGRLIAS